MQSFVIFLFIWMVVVTGALGKRIPHFAGPYRVVVQRITNTSEELDSTGEIWAKLYFSHPKTKQQQYLWGMTYSGTEINDDMKLDVQMSLWANNQWKKNAFVMKFARACTSFLKHARTIIDFAYGEGQKCPIQPQGLKIQKNRTWDFQFPSFPVFPYGRYLFSMGILRDDERIGLIIADLEMKPKF